MTDILDRLTEWKENIAIDITSDWVTQKEKTKMFLQFEQLIIAISNLKEIGQNNNIQE